MRRLLTAALLLVLLVLGSCSFGTNYVNPAGPRYVGGPLSTRASERGASDTLRIVSFNIRYAIEIDSAIKVLASDSALARADLILLQEMDDAGTRRVADALEMAYVYYPATFRKQTGRDFGNAILSRWPIIADAKIILPHLGRFGRTQRSATAATIQIRGRRVRVYSAHMATMVNASNGARRDQLRAILEDARAYPTAVVGGDLNDPVVGRVARDLGYAWPTQEGPRTATVGRLDHVFLKGMTPLDAGTVLEVRNSSDHRPIWVHALLR